MAARAGETAARDGDRLLGFTLPARGARGRLVRLDATLQSILAAHAYPAPIARLLAEALALTALLGTLLRPDEGQLTVQARGAGGPVKLLVADYRDGQLRGYAAQDLDRRFPPAESLRDLFGDGQLVITLDQTAAAERYQGIVALGDGTLEQAARHYFENSEQLPTLVRLAAGADADGRWTAGGLLVQHLPRGEQGAARLHVEDSAHPDWQHVEALAATVSDRELTDATLAIDELLWRLFHEDAPRVLPGQALSRGCRCSTEHIARVLAQFPESDRETMRNADGLIAVDCEFCARQFLLKV